MIIGHGDVRSWYPLPRVKVIEVIEAGNYSRKSFFVVPTVFSDLTNETCAH